MGAMGAGGVPGNNMVFPPVGGAGNIAPAPAGSGLNEANLLTQQNMLAQLQQAHAAALSTNQVPNIGMGGGGGAGGIPQAPQNKAPNNVGLGMNNNGNVGTNNVLLANDQGNVYKTLNNPSANAAAAQSLFFQQAAQGLGGNFPQVMNGGTGPGAGDSNGLARLDSAANLRALINQQISIFNTPAPADLASAMNALGNPIGAPLGAPMPSAGIVQAQGPPTQQAPAMTSLGTTNVAPGFDWNEMIQRMGGGVVDNSAAGNTSASIQQFLQNNNNGATAPAPVNQPFNLNGLLGAGWGVNGPQGPFST